MLQVITGGSASGKSLYGERMATEAGGRLLCYLATMRPWGEEGQARVQKHRQQRAGKGFHTIEVYHSLDAAVLPAGSREDTVILLECLSNLTANELFERGGTDEEIRERIRRGICHLRDCARDVIVITNEVFSDGILYEPETMRYVGLLGQVNRDLAQSAERVTEVVYGIAVPVKPGIRGPASVRE